MSELRSCENCKYAYDLMVNEPCKTCLKGIFGNKAMFEARVKYDRSLRSE